MDQIIVVLIVGALALGKWLIENSGKFQSGNDEPEDEPRPVDRPASTRPTPGPARTYGPPAATPSSRTETDEEKMRRFMEALGLPANSMPPPAQRRVPQPSASSGPQRSPRPIARRLERPAQPEPSPAELQPASRRSIAAPLDTGGPIPDLPKSRPMSESAPAVQVTSFAPAAMAQTQAAVAAAGASVTPEKQGGFTSFAPPSPAMDLRAGLREQLGDPAALRRAILLREILGEPKGLQSAESPSIFSAL